MAGAKQREHFQDKKKDHLRKWSERDQRLIGFLSVHPSGRFHAETQPIWHSKSPAQVKLVTCYYFIIYTAATVLLKMAVSRLRVITFSRSSCAVLPSRAGVQTVFKVLSISHTAYWNDFSLRLVTTMPRSRSWKFVHGLQPNPGCFFWISPNLSLLIFNVLFSDTGRDGGLPNLL